MLNMSSQTIIIQKNVHVSLPIVPFQHVVDYHRNAFQVTIRKQTVAILPCLAGFEFVVRCVRPISKMFYWKYSLLRQYLYHNSVLSRGRCIVKFCDTRYVSRQMHFSFTLQIVMTVVIDMLLAEYWVIMFFFVTHIPARIICFSFCLIQGVNCYMFTSNLLLRLNTSFFNNR